MVKLDKSITSFIKNPDEYVLRWKSPILKAEKKGVLTWIWSHIIDKSSYHLPTIIDNITCNGKISPSTEINITALKGILQEKINTYNVARTWFRRSPIAVQVDSLFRETMTDEKAVRPGDGFLSAEQLQHILGKGRLVDIFFAKNPESEAEQIAFGLQIIDKAGFKICSVPGDGNCLFTSIAIGLLTRMNGNEIIKKFSTAVQEASDPAFKKDVKGFYDIDLGNIKLLDRWGIINERLVKAPDTSVEIDQIMRNDSARRDWIYVLRGLSLINQIKKDLNESRTGTAPLFSTINAAIQDHSLNPENISYSEYVQDMMKIQATEGKIVWGSACDLANLEKCLQLNILLPRADLSGQNDKLVITPPDGIPNEAIHPTPNDILLLFNPGNLHYDPAFFIPKD